MGGHFVKNILRVPFLPRAPPFYTAHARLSDRTTIIDAIHDKAIIM